MIIKCERQSGDGVPGSITVRSEDFHCAETFPDRVKISILRGIEGCTTPFYVSTAEWARIEPLLTGETAPTAPTLPQDVIEAYMVYEQASNDSSASMDTWRDARTDLINTIASYIPGADKADS